MPEIHLAFLYSSKESQVWVLTEKSWGRSGHLASQRGGHSGCSISETQSAWTNHTHIMATYDKLIHDNCKSTYLYSYYCQGLFVFVQTTEFIQTTEWADSPRPPRMKLCRSCTQTQKCPHSKAGRHYVEWRQKGTGSHTAQLWRHPDNSSTPSFPSFSSSGTFPLLFLHQQSFTLSTDCGHCP